MRVTAPIPDAVRDRLFQNFPPVASDIFGLQLTHTYGTVPDHFPRHDLQVEALGLYQDSDCSVLVVSVDGEQYRPDGTRYLIALSLDGYQLRPRDALNRVTEDQIQWLTEPLVIAAPGDGMRFRTLRARVDLPSLNPSYA